MRNFYCFYSSGYIVDKPLVRETKELCFYRNGDNDFISKCLDLQNEKAVSSNLDEIALFAKDINEKRFFEIVEKINALADELKLLVDNLKSSVVMLGTNKFCKTKSRISFIRDRIYFLNSKLERLNETMIDNNELIKREKNEHYEH
ncbi:hypothetical protein KY334_00900 [Candidatus Woesearchaeota archaeon]|nr:hypothetical protein [Candidatus Woesearchaeota archaeon]